MLEDACPAWHASFIKEQTKTIEDVRRVFQVILGNVSASHEACRTLSVSTLSDRRVEQCKTLFRQEIRSMERVSAQCCCILYTVIEIFDCNCNDLELGQFKVIQGQRSWCQSIAHGWFLFDFHICDYFRNI